MSRLDVDVDLGVEVEARFRGSVLRLDFEARFRGSISRLGPEVEVGIEIVASRRPPSVGARPSSALSKRARPLLRAFGQTAAAPLRGPSGEGGGGLPAGPLEEVMYEYTFERLDCFRLATGVAQWAATIHLPAHRRHVRDQLIRAADSVVLNIAEAMAQPAGDARNNHFRIAQGSAGEALAAALLSGAPGCEQRMEELRRVGAMLHKLAER